MLRLELVKKVQILAKQNKNGEAAAGGEDEEKLEEAPQVSPSDLAVQMYY